MNIIKKIIFGLIFGFAFMVNAQKNIKVDVKKDGEVFDHYWSKMVGAGRANEGLRAGWLEQL